jgi:hypothetical protein
MKSEMVELDRVGMADGTVVVVEEVVDEDDGVKSNWAWSTPHNTSGKND